MMLYIAKHQPIICKQKEFYNLHLFNPTTTKHDLVKNKTKQNKKKKKTTTKKKQKKKNNKNKQSRTNTSM